MKRIVVKLAEAVAFIILLPLFAWNRLPFSEYSTFTAAGQILALVPGALGILLRRAWYCRTLKICGANLTMDWLAVIRTRATEVGSNCTFGVGSWIGWAKVGDDVITGSHLVILSGGRQHGFSDTSRPMRLQCGEKSPVVIGSDVWIGARVVIMSDVAPGTVIGAGSVVQKTFPEHSVIAGSPARLIRSR